MPILQDFIRHDRLGRACVCCVEYDAASGEITRVVADNQGPEDLRVTLEDLGQPRTDLIHVPVWTAKTVDVAPGLPIASTTVRFKG